MSGNCGTVSLDRYWSYIGTPLFFITIAAGIFTLFQTQDIQLLDSASIKQTVQQVRDAKRGIPKASATPVTVANPALPARPSPPGPPRPPAGKGSAPPAGKGSAPPAGKGPTPPAGQKAKTD